MYNKLCMVAWIMVNIVHSEGGGKISINPKLSGPYYIRLTSYLVHCKTVTMSPQCVETSFYLISCVISTQRQHGQHTQLGVACKVQCVLFWWLVVLTQGAYQLMAEDSTPVCRMWWAIIAHRALILKQHVPCQGHRKDFWSGDRCVCNF